MGRVFGGFRNLLKGRTARAVSLLGFGIVITAHPVMAAEKTELLFVLDSSGSMKEKIEGQPKIILAKAALTKNLESIPEGVSVGLRVFAHRVEQTKKQESCKDTELIVPIASPESAEIKEALLNANPRGYTPLAYALEQTRGDFSVEAEAEKVVIVLSDGEETCGGDPVAVVNKLKADGIKLTVNTVGFDVDAKTRAQLQAIAAAGGGSYYDAKDSLQLFRALEEATKKIIVKRKERKITIEGTPIRGGDNFKTAVPLPPDTLFRLDHHLMAGDADYFSIKLKRGDEITLTVRTLELGLRVSSNGTAEETGSPNIWASFFSPSREKLFFIDESGRLGRNNKTFKAREDGLHYLEVGGPVAQHKDGSAFQYSIRSASDLGGEVDAGDSWETALAITPDRYTENMIGGADQRDCFRFSAKKGERYRVGIIPNSEESGNFSYTVKDDFKRQIENGSSGTNQGVKGQPFEIPETGDYLLQITNYSGALFKYTFELVKLDPEPAAEGGE